MPQKSDTTLLVMDMQEALLGSLPGSDELIPRIAKAIEYARNSGIPVIYVAVGFRDGFPEISPAHKSFSTFPSRMPGYNMAKMTKIAAALAPAENEPLVIKKRYSAFTGSDLEVILRSNSIRHLVLTGVITSGVVLSTFMEAADKDYRLTVLSDACIDRDAALHQMLVDKLFPRLGDVRTCEEWAQ